MKLTLFTQPNCPRCPAAKKVAEALANQRADITLEILDLSDTNNMTTALMLQIASTPSFVLDTIPIFIGDIPSLQELNARIDEYKQRKP